MEVKKELEKKDIKIVNVNKSFDGVQILKDINLTIEQGEFFSIIGPYTRMFYGTWGYILVYENIASIFKGVLNPLRVVFIPYALCIAYFFFVLINKKEFFLTSFLKKFGVYSLPIYVFHRPIRDAFSYYVLNKVSFGRFEEEILIIIMAILSFICCYILGNRFTDRVCRPF